MWRSHFSHSRSALSLVDRHVAVGLLIADIRSKQMSFTLWGVLDYKCSHAGIIIIATPFTFFCDQSGWLPSELSVQTTAL